MASKYTGTHFYAVPSFFLLIHQLNTNRMKHILRMLLMIVAFIIIVPFMAIYCLWEFDFSPVRQLYRDFLETMGYPFRSLFKKKRKSSTTVFAVIAFIAIFMLQSCRTTGYGCKGRMSWEQVVRKANRPY
jgi:uncharacterized membrane protein YfhO